MLLRHIAPVRLVVASGNRFHSQRLGGARRPQNRKVLFLAPVGSNGNDEQNLVKNAIFPIPVNIVLVHFLLFFASVSFGRERTMFCARTISTVRTIPGRNPVLGSQRTMNFTRTILGLSRVGIHGAGSDLQAMR